jgi:uncharacterized membrane protein AbrB (regulator of aidB expression)
MTAASGAYLMRGAEWSRSTAFFASVPGALTYVMVVSMRSSADTRLVMMAQMLRVVALVLVLPVLITTACRIRRTSPPAPRAAIGACWPRSRLAARSVFSSSGGISPAGCCSAACWGLAFLHLSGGISGPMPQAILIPCQIVTGCLIGLRFHNTDLRFLAKAIAPSSMSFLIALSVAAPGR